MNPWVTKNEPLTKRNESFRYKMNPRHDSIIAVVIFHNRTLSLIERVRFFYILKSLDLAGFQALHPKILLTASARLRRAEFFQRLN